MGMGLEARFERYGAATVAAMGHANRAAPTHWYLQGLMLPGGRKSVEPMAARVRPEDVRATHQSMHHLVSTSAWSDDALLAAVAAQVLPALTRDGAAPCFWIIDDTGFPKKGTHSVGVARQYCGQTGKTDNCRVAVSLSLATDANSLPLAYQLYLPAEWADDPQRRADVGVRVYRDAPTDHGARVGAGVAGTGLSHCRLAARFGGNPVRPLRAGARDGRP